jgi:hypothetical protein
MVTLVGGVLVEESERLLKTYDGDGRIISIFVHIRFDGGILILQYLLLE